MKPAAKSFQELYSENQRAAEIEQERDASRAASSPTLTLTNYVGEGEASSARLAFDAAALTRLTRSCRCGAASRRARRENGRPGSPARPLRPNDAAE